MRIIKAADLEESFFEYEEMEEIAVVKEILGDVKTNGDDAVRGYTLQFDEVALRELRVETNERREAYLHCSKEIISCIKQAGMSIEKFARKQLKPFKDFEIEITPGVFCGQRVIPIERVGVYVPAGRFPLVSSLLMCVIPAKIAGVEEIAVCSPPSYNKSVHPMILAAAEMVGVDEIYRIGGAQAIAAMAYGTKTIKKVNKIVGPGNKYVVMAKREVFGVVGIDFMAGPTEIMIIADEKADPRIVAADLLAQAEHDREAVPILVTTSFTFAEKVKEEITLQLHELGTKSIAVFSVEKNGIIIIVNDMKEAIALANRKAPEHLELLVKTPSPYTTKLRNYGSLFLGKNSTQVLGDYGSGLNHVLPTNGSARYTGGLGVKDFIKLQTTLRVIKKGLSAIGPTAKALAEMEGLEGHTKSILMRMKEKRKLK